MSKLRFLPLALACMSVLSIAPLNAGTIIEDFSIDPLQNGWNTFGQANLFQWDSTNHNLRVTWDSSQPNSYFYHSLDTILTRDDDFSLAFDMRLDDIGPGPNTNKPSTFPIAVGFLNLDGATQTNFVRGTGSNSPDLAEVAYFWDCGYGATLWPTFVDTNSSFNYNGSSDFEVFEMAPGDRYHIRMTYTASNQTVVAAITNSQQTSGALIMQMINPTNFSDFRLGTLSISSYSDAGQDPQYAGSVLAHGVLDNFVVTVPAPPMRSLMGTLSNGVWQAQFNARTGWIYTLQRTTDFQSWTDASSARPDSSGLTFLSDTNATSEKGFYRIQANRP